MSEANDPLARRLALGAGVKLLASHPSGLVALEKPVGILAHPNKASDRARSLICGHYDAESRCYTRLQGEACLPEVYLLHRLDSATSGVILVATSKELAEAVIQCFEQGRVLKEYAAIVEGKPKSLPSRWRDRLSRQSGGQAPARMQVGKGALAETEQHFLRADGNGLGLSLMKLQPLTGRTHQLRVQCARRGHPIAGDRKYGDFGLNRRIARLPFGERLFLHASSVQLQLFFGGERLRFSATSPLPEAFEQLLANSRVVRQALQPTPAEIHQRQQKRLGHFSARQAKSRHRH